MESKQCTGNCKQIKPISEFAKHKTGKFGVQSKCKTCQNEINKQLYLDNTEVYKERCNNYREKNKTYYRQKGKEHMYKHKDGKHHVYLLPEVNYVGVTDNIYMRMTIHKSNNNITDLKNYQILFSFHGRHLALMAENILHNKGYKGKKGEQNKNLLNNK